MRSFPLLLIASALSVACTEAPSAPSEKPRPAFITSGQPDAERHPYVGLIVLETEDGPVGFCSGSLLSPTVVLTAGHCTDGFVAARIWMDESLAENQEFPFGGATSYEGTPHANPDFCIGCGPGLPGFDLRDVGVVVLSEPVPTSVVDEYVQLPTAGLVETLANKSTIDLVGYGAQEKFHPPEGGPPFMSGVLARFFAPAQLVSGNFVHSDEFIRLTANPAQGKGGPCFGDSGGPNLVGGTDRVIAVTSYGTNRNCSGVGYSSRIDIPEVLSWIQSFLD
jgi:secreted trypsin-like serine protease